MSLRYILVALSAIVGMNVAITAPAHAACSTSTVVNFGTVNLTSPGNFDISGTVDITCSGLAHSTQYRVCPIIGTPRELNRLPDSGTINYELYSDPSHVIAWGDTPGSGPGFLITSDGSGAGSVSGSIYGRIPSGQSSVPTTASSKTYTGAPAVNTYAAPTSSAATCTEVSTQNPGGGTAIISAVYEPACTIAVNPLAFGSLTSTVSGANATTSLQTNCTPGTEYTISMDLGANGGIDPQVRYMMSGANTLVYGVYHDAAHSQPWGPFNMANGTGIGGPVSTNIYGRIQPQTTPPSGTYTDQVVVTINY